MQFSARRLQAAWAAAGIQWELTAAGEDDPRVGALLAIDPAQVAQPQGYRLLIAPDRIRLTGHDAAGVFYGVATLVQLLYQHFSSLPCLRVDDWPDFPHRGVMLDISRDKVPTLETLYELVELLASWKVNQVQLYIEHTFAYRDHEVVWAKASPLTGDEILALDAWCRQRFVELVPNQNSFGHLHRWLKHDRYRHLAEVPEGFDLRLWGGSEHEPFSLCPDDPDSIAFLRSLYAELLPHFTSRQFNVGCDETFDLGRGRSRQACEEQGTGRVYLDFLKEIHRLVRGHGRTMQFWGDIIMHYPELIPELPPGVIALEWGYEADHPFAADGARFGAAGIPFYVCPGTSSWNSLVGRTDNAKGNLVNAAESGLAHGAIGYLNTDWGDNGHLQYLPVSYLGFADGAGLSWAVAANRDLDLPRVLDLFAFRDAAGVMGRLAYELGNAYRACGVETSNNSVPAMPLLYPHWVRQEDQHPGFDLSAMRRAFNAVQVEGLQRTIDHIDNVLAGLSRARMARSDANLIIDEFRNGAAMLRHACRLRIAWMEAARLADVPMAVRAELAANLEGIMAEHKRLWLARNRPGGLADSIGAHLEPWLAFYCAR